MRRLVILLSLLAGCLGQPPDRKVTAAVSVAGMKQIAGVAALASASLQITCTDGTIGSATALDPTADPVTFTPVPACGDAHLVLTANVRSSSGPVTAYVGTADAKLVAGNVAVTFAGPLYGEVDFASASGATFTCTGAPQTISVPATHVVVPLPVGNYTLACTSSDGSDFSQAVTVTAGTRGTVALPPGPTQPPGQPNDATLGSLIPAFGALSPAFDPTILSYELLLSSRRSQISFHAPANNPLATVAVSSPGATGQPSPLAAAAVTDVSVTVTSADTTATKTYVVHVTRGLVTDIQMSIVSAVEGTFYPSTFSLDQPLYLFTDIGAVDVLSVSMSGPIGVQLAVGGTSVVSGVAVQANIPLGRAVVTLEASAPGATGAAPETDSYWIQAQNAAEAPNSMLAVLSNSGNQIGLQQVSDGLIYSFNGSAASQPTTSDPVDLQSPIGLAASPDGSVVYFSGTAVADGTSGKIAWLDVADQTPSFTGSSGAFTTSSPFAPTLLAADPKQRLLFAGNVVAGTASVESFTINAATGNNIVPAAQVQLPGFSLTALCADPLGRFLYAAFASNTQNGIAVFWVNPNGTLELIKVLDTNTAVAQLAASSQGDALVFADGANLETFTIDSLGGLVLSAQLPSIDASAGLAVFENPSALPFVTLFAGGNLLSAEFGASFQLGGASGSVDPGSFGLVVDRTGQSIYYIDGNSGGLSSQIIPTSATGAFSPDFTNYQTLPVPPSAIIYFDAWQGMSAG